MRPGFIGGGTQPARVQVAAAPSSGGDDERDLEGNESGGGGTGGGGTPGGGTPSGSDVVLSVDPSTATIARLNSQVFTVSATSSNISALVGGTLSITRTNTNFTVSPTSVTLIGDPPSAQFTVGYIGSSFESTQITIAGLGTSFTFTVSGF